MIAIDAIMDLARVMEPGAPRDTKPKFSLACDRDGQWTATVQMVCYWCDATGTTADDALAALQKQLVALAEQSREGAIARLKRWVTGNRSTVLKLVKEGA